MVRLDKYMIMLIVPIPVSLLVGAYASEIYKSSLREYLTGNKEIPTIPEFPIIGMKQEVELDKVFAGIEFSTQLHASPEGTVQESPNTGAKEGKPPDYVLTFTFIGEKRYAILNGSLYREGDIVGEEKIARIEKGKVLLTGRWGKRWVSMLR